jgi:DNA-binding HxlR family transcriptional regulator
MTNMGTQEGKNSIPSHTDLTVEGIPDHPAACVSISEVLARIGDKWSVLVVMMLRGGPRRFNEIKRGVAGISQHMLTLTLRGLERDGLVMRTVFPTIPRALITGWRNLVTHCGCQLRRSANGPWPTSLPSKRPKPCSMSGIARLGI